MTHSMTTSNKKQPAILVDIDGTLALCGDRNPYDHASSIEDTVNPVTLEIARRFAETHTVILLSSRLEQFRAVTELWMQFHHIPPWTLIMRQDGDSREDNVVKRELYLSKIEPMYDVLFVLDDRTRVVNMWRSLGLTCLQVAEGDF